MQSSSTQRLRNDINECEDASDRKIPADSYYVVKVMLGGDATIPLATQTLLVKELTKREFETDGRPLASYVYGRDVYFLFSSLEGTQHFLAGSHHAITSFYASYFAKTLGVDARCSIIELDSRTRILIYFQSKIYENAKTTVKSYLPNEKEFTTLTFAESIKLLAKKSSIRWDDLPPNERFGTFYKLVTSHGKDRFAVMSEMIDIRDQNRYMSYLFE